MRGFLKLSIDSQWIRSTRSGTYAGWMEVGYFGAHRVPTQRRPSSRGFVFDFKIPVGPGLARIGAAQARGDKVGAIFEILDDKDRIQVRISCNDGWLTSCALADGARNVRLSFRAPEVMVKAFGGPGAGRSFPW
jgi:hypothetical protein